MARPANMPQRRERLSSLTGVGKESIGPYRAKRNTPPVPAPVPPPVRACCDNPTVSSDESTQICYNCGQVLRSDHDIVADITFAENAAGGAVIEGGFIGEGQRHANSMGGTMRGLGGMGSREQSEMNGRDEIRKLCAALHLPARIEDQAFSWYKLGLNHRFVQGRRIRNVAAVAIYLAARRQPQNTVLLMDLAEKVHVNVWALGDTYKQFCKTVMVQDPSEIVGSTTVQEIEPLMLKFCYKLEFGNDSHKVASDACMVLKRMKRDWMVQGRNPAGICGACIILAARMNNFRRTVREVVYVVRVADATVNQRLYEFKRTPSSNLTVDQFRKFGQRLKVKNLPPAIWRREEKEQRMKARKRKVHDEQDDDEGTPSADADDMQELGEGDLSQVPPRNSKQLTRAAKKPKSNNGKGKGSASSEAPTENNDDREMIDVDALIGDNEAVLDSVARGLSGDGSNVNEEEIVVPKRRGRKPKKREPIVIPEEDLEIEEELENEINESIKDWESTFKEFENNDNHDILRRAVETGKRLASMHRPDLGVSDDPDIAEGEFEDDPDVATCVMAPDEVLMKERIWITENEDWMREQQAKMLAKALEEAEGKPKKPKQKRKYNQMGDGSVLEGRPAANAAEATKKMLEKRAKHMAKAIDYEKLRELFPGASAQDGDQQEQQVQSPSAAQGQNADADADAEGEVGGEDGEGKYEEEDQEEYPEEEYEEDLEANYLEDEDVGFDPDEDWNY